jgi:hypothetical protein
MDKKAQKKKDRAKKVHKQLLRQRADLMAKRVEENNEHKKLKRVKKLKKQMGDLNVWADEVFMKMTDETLDRLEKNALILKALEAEYRREADKKAKLNEELEAAGHHTLDAKLNHLHNKMVDAAKDMYETGGLTAGDVVTNGLIDNGPMSESLRAAVDRLEAETSEIG